MIENQGFDDSYRECERCSLQVVMQGERDFRRIDRRPLLAWFLIDSAATKSKNYSFSTVLYELILWKLPFLLTLSFLSFQHDRIRKTEIMHSSAILSMARGKGKTIPIKLLSTAGTGFFYTTRKNITRTPQKLSFLKYDPVVQRHVLFKEGKIKQIIKASRISFSEISRLQNQLNRE